MDLLERLHEFYPWEDDGMQGHLVTAIAHRAPQAEDDPFFQPLHDIDWRIEKLARHLGEQDEWTTQETDAARLIIALSSQRYGRLDSIVDLCAGNPSLENKLLEINQTLPVSMQFKPEKLAKHLPSCWSASWDLAPDPVSADAPFLSNHANRLWALSDGEITDICQENNVSEGFLAHFSAHRPAVIRAAIAHQKNLQHPYRSDLWRAITTATNSLDDAILDFFFHALDPANMRHDFYSTDVGHLIDVFGEVILRNPPSEAILRIARSRPTASRPIVMDYLLVHQPETALADVTRAVCRLTPYTTGPELEKYFTLAKKNLNGEGYAFFAALLRNRRESLAFTGLLNNPGEPDATRTILLDHAATLESHDLWEFWERLLRANGTLFHPEIHAFLKGKSKPLQRHAAQALIDYFPDEVSTITQTLIHSKKGQDRLGAYEILRTQNTPDSQRLLAEAYATESGQQLQKHLLAIFKEQGVSIAEKAPPTPSKPAPVTLADFIALVTKKHKSIRLPKATWLDVEQLPALIDSSGSPIPELLLTYIFQKQAQHKDVAVHPDLVSLMPHFPREKNQAFAEALLAQWLASDMKANSKWALTLTGLLGDDSLIPLLTERMEPWCKANHGKRAEWATTAIALLGTDRALTTINTLIQQFKTKRKYIATAARRSLQLLAEQRGTSVEELSDLIIPQLGFSTQGTRDFTTSKGNVTALLQPDFKIHWLRPDSDHPVTTTPNNLTEEAKEQLKELRGTVKLETQRLENALVQQRPWTLKQWQKLFAKHPLMQQFASRLIWYYQTSRDSPPVFFRRYANGILANATGDLIEFETLSDDTHIQLAHPLHFSQDTKTLSAWNEHLARFKIKSPFPQINRPVELLDSAHANRTQLTLTNKVTLDSSRFRTLLENHSWSLGPAEDGGWIYEAWRKFPADGIEVSLAIEYHASWGWGEQVTLGNAHFRDSIDPISHLPSHSEAVPFSKVPAIVYSEVISDLQAITEEQN